MVKRKMRHSFHNIFITQKSLLALKKNNTAKMMNSYTRRKQIGFFITIKVMGDIPQNQLKQVNYEALVVIELYR